MADLMLVLLKIIFLSILILCFFNCQECRAAGCRSLAEAKAYIEQKRKRELEATVQKAKETKEGNQVVASSKVMQKAARPMNREKGESDGSPRNIIDNHKIRGAGLDSGSKDLLSATFDDWDIIGLPGSELLSEHVSAPGTGIMPVAFILCF